PRTRYRRGRPYDANHRPLLLQVDLLPRAERRAVRDRDARRRGLRGRRAGRVARRAAQPATRLRAHARAARAHSDTASVTFAERPAEGDALVALVLFHGL